MLASNAMADATVTNVQLLRRCDRVQLIVETSAPVRFDLLALHNPDRAVLDLEGCGR